MELLRKYIASTIEKFLTEQLLNENVKDNIIKFLSGKKFINPKSKIFLYHGTKIKPDNFVLSDYYEGEDSNAWSGDLPEGYLFLTTDIKEAAAYGPYIIPCELKKYDNKFFKVNSDSPSQVFDDDYGVSLNKQTNFGFWEKFEESGKNVLIIKGTKRYTIITDIDNIIPRIDLAKEFYTGEAKSNEIKQKKEQLNIILKANPMLDDYHTGIRCINDIKTLEEIAVEEDPTTNPDFGVNDIKKAIQTKSITIYSSYPIKNGTFVTPSKMEAKNYAGDGKVYALKTNIYDVAWIDAIEGVFAKKIDHM